MTTALHRNNPEAGVRPTLVAKVVAYVVQHGQLLVFTHDSIPLHLTGVQVPAGTIDPGERPCDAVVREVYEETGLQVRIVRELGVAQYDMRPTKPHIHHRHFFHLVPAVPVSESRWQAGEEHPSHGDVAQPWTCWWMPLRDAHVLCAGFGAFLGQLAESDAALP